LANKLGRQSYDRHQDPRHIIHRKHAVAAKNYCRVLEQTKCWELTTLWVARLDDGVELKVTDPEEQQGDVEEEEAEGEERRDEVDGGASC